MEQGGVDDKQNNYILSFIQRQNQIALSYCDVSTGELKTTQFEGTSTLLNEITTINPNEIVVNQALSDALTRQINLTTETITVNESLSQNVYEVNPKRNLDVRSNTIIVRLYSPYSKRDLSHIEDVKEYAAIDFMKMDYYAKRNLELTESIRLKSKRHFYCG